MTPGRSKFGPISIELGALNPTISFYSQIYTKQESNLSRYIKSQYYIAITWVLFCFVLLRKCTELCQSRPILVSKQLEDRQKTSHTLRHDKIPAQIRAVHPFTNI